MRRVGRVAPLDHPRRALVQRARGADFFSGREQFIEPSSAARGSLRGERPRSGAVRGEEAAHVL